MNSKPTSTIADVARQAGVSTATVSRVLNGTARVEAATADRVQAAVTALGYTPLPAARILAGRKTRTLGLVIPEIGGPFFVPLLRGIESAARQAGYSLLIQAGDANTGLALGGHNTDGLLVYTGALSAHAIAGLTASGLPVVHLYAQPSGANSIPAVTVDNLGGAQAVMAHFAQVHHRRRIVFLAGPDDEPDAQARLLGYRQALRQFGLVEDPALVILGGFSQQTAQNSLADLVQRGISFDAVFAADDQSAVGALEALNHAGIAVPGTVSLAGFDDVAFAAYLNPPLTTVHAPTDAVGEAAVQTLLRAIQGQAVEPLVCLSTSLQVRRSCGCLPSTSSPDTFQSEGVNL